MQSRSSISTTCAASTRSSPSRSNALVEPSPRRAPRHRHPRCRPDRGRDRHRLHRRRPPVRHSAPLRRLQRHRTHRGRPRDPKYRTGSTRAGTVSSTTPCTSPPSPRSATPTPPGRVYYDRKIAEGKTNKEAIRALKRRISDAVYRQLLADSTADCVRAGPGGQPGATLIQRDRPHTLTAGSSDQPLPNPNPRYARPPPPRRGTTRRAPTRSTTPLDNKEEFVRDAFAERART